MFKKFLVILGKNDVLCPAFSTDSTPFPSYLRLVVQGLEGIDAHCTESIVVILVQVVNNPNFLGVFAMVFHAAVPVCLGNRDYNHFSGLPIDYLSQGRSLRMSQAPSCLGWNRRGPTILSLCDRILERFLQQKVGNCPRHPRQAGVEQPTTSLFPNSSIRVRRVCAIAFSQRLVSRVHRLGPETLPAPFQIPCKTRSIGRTHL